MINVLVVEDDPMVAQLNKDYIESVDGFKVCAIAKNGHEALSIIKAAAIDLIILDIYMPKLDGVSFLKELRRRNMMIDVILVTAAQEAENISTMLKLGAIDYLIKPFEYERLKSALDNYTVRHRLLKDKQLIKQEDIDKITKRTFSASGHPLPKGLHRASLDRVRKFMKNNANDPITSEVLAEKIGVSRVTARRYLEYLVSINEVKLEVEYGSMGRPSHLYKYTKHKES